MAKGAWKGILKDDVNLAACNIKDGQQVTITHEAIVLRCVSSGDIPLTTEESTTS